MTTNILLSTELGPEFDVNQTQQKVLIKVDGTSITKSTDGTLSAATIGVDFDSAGGIITFTPTNGDTPQTVDLSQFLTDLQVTGGSFDAATSVLTLVDNDNDSVDDIVIDLSTLLGVSTDANNLLSNGADGKPKLLAGDLNGTIDDRVDASATTNVSSVFGTDIVRGFTVN